MNKEKSFIENLSEVILGLKKVVEPYVKVFAAVIKSLNEFLEDLVNSPGFKEFIHNIEYFSINSSLIKHYWFVFDKDLFDLILKNKNEDRTNFDDIILNYYSQNNYASDEW